MGFFRSTGDKIQEQVQDADHAVIETIREIKKREMELPEAVRKHFREQVKNHFNKEFDIDNNLN